MKIVNIVSTVSLTTSLNLNIIHERLPNTVFSGKSNWLQLRLPPNNTYIAFYKSGKFLITVNDPKKINSIATRVRNLLWDIGIDTQIVKIEIHNIVIQTTIPLKTSLEAIIINLDPRKASFEPEQFPALIYKNWNVSFLLFSSGKLIIAGLKDIKTAKVVISNFKRIIFSK